MCFVSSLNSNAIEQREKEKHPLCVCVIPIAKTTIPPTDNVGLPLLSLSVATGFLDSSTLYISSISCEPEKL